MAEEKMTTTVKVLANSHEFAEIKDGMVEIPNHLVQTYASLGTIELPKDFEKKQTAKEAK